MNILMIGLCLVIASEVNGARIVGLFPIPSFSHQIVYRALMKELHSRGHELLIFTPDPINDPNLKNYTEIDLSSSYKIWKKLCGRITQTLDEGVSVVTMLLDYVQTGLDLCEVQLNLPQVKHFIKENKVPFDLVIAEWILTPCFAVIPYKLGTPLIGISSIPPTLGVHEIVGNPAHPAYSPDILLGYTDHPSFMERIHSTLHYIVYHLVYHYMVMPANDAVMRRIFSDISMPYVEEIVNNVSVLLVNSHFSFYYPRPNTISMVEIAGLHLSRPKPLPKNLQAFLDGAPEGVIYFSLGTNVRSDTMSATKRQMFLDAFSELPQFRVLWKWESDTLPAQSNNVMMAKWLPQQDILDHPKIKVFIYQGGLQSTEEAIRVQVPVIGIPFFADQHFNVRKIVDIGAGVKLDFKYLKKEAILDALNKTIYDPTYKENMKKLSKITEDQPEDPLERAVWWTEYVIRHKGAPHVRSAVLELKWYQYLLLDVLAFMIFISCITLWLLHILLRYAISKITSCNKPISRLKID